MATPTALSASHIHSDLGQYLNIQHSSSPLQGEHKSHGSYFVPYLKHDVAFTSLRLVIFQIDSKSATPIAHILREQLSDAEVFVLIHQYQQYSKAIQQQEDSRSKRPLVKAAKPLLPPKLRAKIDEAREKHADNLGVGKMVDVEIMYTGTAASIGAMEFDRHAIEGFGGRIYHLWPYDHAKQSIGMSVIVGAQKLMQLYSSERRTNGINIIHNTQPAAQHSGSSVGPRPPHDDDLPYGPPIKSSESKAAPSLSHDDPDRQQAWTDQAIVDRYELRYRSHQRSRSTEATLDAPLRPWHQFPSSLRLDKQQPDWKPNEGPFSRTCDPSNHSWWLADHADRQSKVAESDAAYWEKKLTTPEDHFPVSPTVAEKHFGRTQPIKIRHRRPAVPSLCRTYAPGYSDKWLSGDIRGRKLKDIVRTTASCDAAELEYKTKLNKLKIQNESMYRKLQHAKQNLDSFDALNAAIDARDTTIVANRELGHAKERVLQARQACGKQGGFLHAGLDDYPAIEKSQKLYLEMQDLYLQQELRKAEEGGPISAPDEGTASTNKQTTGRAIASHFRTDAQKSALTALLEQEQATERCTKVPTPSTAPSLIFYDNASSPLPAEDSKQPYAISVPDEELVGSLSSTSKPILLPSKPTQSPETPKFASIGIMTEPGSPPLRRIIPTSMTGRMQREPIDSVFDDYNHDKEVSMADNTAKHVHEDGSKALAS